MTLVLSALFGSFFAALELAFISSNRLKFEIEKNKGSYIAGVLSKFSANPSTFISSLLAGKVIFLIIFIIISARLVTNLTQIPTFSEPGQTWFHYLILILLIVTFVLITGEILPKIVVFSDPNKILNFLIIPYLPIHYVLFPLTFIVNQVSGLVLRLFFKTRPGILNYHFNPVGLEEYLKELANYERTETEVNQEIQMFQNVIDFKLVKIRECMVPRTEIKAIGIHEPIEVLKQMFIDTGLSRILVFSETLDDSFGYIHSSDIFKNQNNLRELVRPLLFFPEAMPANTALSSFIAAKKNIAVILDEFGGISGLVTMEDILEEILGDITDEYDKEELHEKVISENEFEMSARLEIDYLNEKYKIGLPVSGDYETLAGLIIQHHESIPVINDEIWIGKFRFTILEAHETKIIMVKIRISETD